uniref:Uncharacterized protein n=1 Tax=mine drainage metagenome TaxID=410659 RepID=E6Q8T5_9ZZZZ
MIDCAPVFLVIYFFLLNFILKRLSFVRGLNGCIMLCFYFLMNGLTCFPFRNQPVVLLCVICLKFTLLFGGQLSVCF